MADFFTTKGTLTVSIGEGYLSSFEASTLKVGDVVRTTQLAGTPCALLFNGVPLCQCEIVILDDLFGVRVLDRESPNHRVPGPGSRDDLVEILPTMIVLGSIRMSLAELKEVGDNTLVSLGVPLSKEGDADLFVAGIPVARGKVVVIEEEMGIRITAAAGSAFAEKNVRASGYLLERDDSRRIKDYDFSRPDKFSKAQIDRMFDIHTLFLRNLKTRLPDLAKVLSTLPHPAVVDQCTLGELALDLEKTGPFGRFVSENIRGKRPGSPSMDGARRPSTAKVLVEEEGTAHPVAAGVREYAKRLQGMEDVIHRSPVFIYYRDTEPLKRWFAEEEFQEAVLACLRGGWKNLMDMNFRKVSAGDSLAKPAALHPNEMVIAVTCAGRDTTSAIVVAYPYLTLEPFMGILG